MKRFIRQMINLPLTAFVYSMEMFVKTMQGLQRIADHGLNEMMSGVAESLGDAPDQESGHETDQTTTETTEAATRRTDSPATLNTDARTAAARDIVADVDQINLKEERKMPDTNLNDDMLKLIRYKILFVKRDYEVAFPEVEELVHDNMTSTAYTAWKIAEFIQNLAAGKTSIPSKWNDGYPNDKDKDGNYKYRKDGMLIGLPEDDKKYLRVYYEVLDRYVREEFRYEEDQIDVLKEIRDAIRQKEQGGASASGGSGSSGSGGGSYAGGGMGGATAGSGAAGGGTGTA